MPFPVLLLSVALACLLAMFIVPMCLKKASVRGSDYPEQETIHDLEGSWLLVDRVGFEGALPQKLTFRRITPTKLTVSPPLMSNGEELGNLEVGEWFRNDHPTSVRMRCMIDFHFLAGNQIGIQTSEMDVFGLGAYYERQKQE